MPPFPNVSTRVLRDFARELADADEREGAVIVEELLEFGPIHRDYQAALARGIDRARAVPAEAVLEADAPRPGGRIEIRRIRRPF